VKVPHVVKKFPALYIHWTPHGPADISPQSDSLSYDPLQHCETEHAGAAVMLWIRILEVLGSNRD
jgi:hypothetical protein